MYFKPGRTVIEIDDRQGVFLIDMTPVFSGETDAVIIDGPFFLSPGALPEIEPRGPVALKGVITNMSGYIRLALRAELCYTAKCARCLRDVDVCLAVDLDKTLAAAESIQDPEADEIISDYILINGNKLDLGEAVTEQLLLELPYRHLCSEDCKGLCPSCGRDLNAGDCGCVKDDTDPRLSGLRELLDRIKKEKPPKNEIDD